MLGNEMQRGLGGATLPPPNPLGWWEQSSRFGGGGRGRWGCGCEHRGLPRAPWTSTVPHWVPTPLPRHPLMSPPAMGSTHKKRLVWGPTSAPSPTAWGHAGDMSRVVAGPHSGQAGDVIPAWNWPRFSPGITLAPQKSNPREAFCGEDPAEVGAAPSQATPAHAYSTGCTTTTEYSSRASC